MVPEFVTLALSSLPPLAKIPRAVAPLKVSATFIADAFAVIVPEFVTLPVINSMPKAVALLLVPGEFATDALAVIAPEFVTLVVPPEMPPETTKTGVLVPNEFIADAFAVMAPEFVTLAVVAPSMSKASAMPPLGPPVWVAVTEIVPEFITLQVMQLMMPSATLLAPAVPVAIAEDRAGIHHIGGGGSFDINSTCKTPHSARRSQPSRTCQNSLHWRW